MKYNKWTQVGLITFSDITNCHWFIIFSPALRFWDSFLMSFHAMTKEFSKQVHLFQRPPLLLHCPDRLHPNTKPYLCFWSLERNITSTKLLYKSQHPPMTHPETASKTISLTASQSSLTKTIVWYNNYVVFTPYSRCIHVSYC